MPELETLFVRIDADLSDFKRGLREAGRETRAFANEANRAFADVGTALDLSPFRKELAQSERAASQAAERMSKAFAKVGKAQHQAALKALEKFGGAPGALVLVSPQGVIETPVGSTDAPADEERIGRTISGAIAGAPLLIPLLLLPGINVTLLSILALMTAGAGVGALGANADLLFEGDSQRALSLDEQIENLGRTIDDLKNKQLSRPRGGPPLAAQIDAKNEELKKARQELTDALALKDAIAEQQRLAQESAARSQEFLRAFTELSDCLRQLCARIDELSSAPSGAAGAGGVRPDGIGFDGSRGSGRFTLASFDGHSPFGGAGLDGLNRELADARGPLDDLSAGFVELTDAAGDFEVQGGSIAELLARSNALLGEQSGLLGQLTAQAPVLGGELGALFEAGAQEGRVFAEVTDALGASLRDAFEGAIERGESLSDVLKDLALDMAEIALKAAGNAVLESILGGLLGGLAGGVGGGSANAFGGGGVAGAFDASTFGDSGFSPSFAKGGAFEGGRLIEMAKGGVLNRPLLTPLADGVALLGEAGPEGVLPLARMGDGRLGVLAQVRELKERSAPPAAGAAPVNLSVTINAPGADREGLARVERKIDEFGDALVRVNGSIEGRAIRAWVNHRRRGGFG